MIRRSALHALAALGLTSAPLCALARQAENSAPGFDWDSVLAPADVDWPAPLEQLEWRSELVPALERAQASGRPLLVTLRCLPCKQCATFDRQVLEPDPELEGLLRQFVTVRLTDARALDLSLLPAAGFQDFDMSWWAYFLSPQGRTYGVFGGRDHVSDATRISQPALVATLGRVLDHHYHPRREDWDLDGPRPPHPGASSPLELEGYASWARAPREPETCLHCHQVGEILRQPALDAGRFDTQRDLGIWPLPENVGLVLERDHGLRVTEVTPDGPAARAGLRKGDVLAVAAQRRLFGQTDLRAALQREADPSGEIELHWLRDGRRMRARLMLEPGWRATVLDWRMSVSQGNIGAPPGFAWALPGPRERVQGEGMCIEPWFGRGAAKGVAHAAGLRPGHLIVAVDGAAPDLSGRPFMTWFRLHHAPGDTVTLTVLEGETRREIRYTLPGPPSSLESE